MNQILNNHINKLQYRIIYLEQQIAAQGRLDGYNLKGHKEELKKVKEELNNTEIKNDTNRI